ncbi:NADH dehydrogenase [ubiquinone] 1 alpha subcomplex subunit 5 [Procambarus clarkii]|uniref:NADH dehydrogenase [ubiquinone] 1 alpha subcomplex subunit 5 n=1 Tax=Procambarus clarkii TaxID=6728 RepID=UPI001E676C1A|nr:NADH dehydrogenase [ubiquinone] 1 alpha subcomplex subunit 5-like [Procambarus clarkii]
MAARKVSTALTGLPVARNPHHTLGVLYGKIMRCLQKMPHDAAYRKYTEQIIGERSALVKTEADVSKLEKAISCGQIEEVIQQAENELTLARKMLDWKPWEPLVQEPLPGQWKWPI